MRPRLHLLSTYLIAALLAPRHLPAQSANASGSAIIDTGGASNSNAQQKKHYVVLVSLDGFRYDYVRAYDTTHLKELARTGATAVDGMLPSYPSITFPNHFTLVTGLFPEHHGIVNNIFYDPARDKSYSNKVEAAQSDGSWYSGTPLWSLAEQQGMRAASFFWPGSEAKIAGERPDEYLRFDDKFDDHKRIDQLVAWLKLPPAERPHLITLYYSNADHAGHNFGQGTPELKAAVLHLDQLMGELKEKLDSTRLSIDLVVVADHGMINADGDWIELDKFADLSNFKHEGMLLYAPSEADAQKAYEEFRAHPDPRFTAYRRAEVPAYLNFNSNPREGDPVIVPNGPYVFTVKPPTKKASPGDHGYDVTRMPEMKALFVANGPDIRPATKLDSFPNVDVYDFICKLLGLKPAANDGDLKPLRPALRKP